jgi:hypothetical protein
MAEAADAAMAEAADAAMAEAAAVMSAALGMSMEAALGVSMEAADAEASALEAAAAEAAEGAEGAADPAGHHSAWSTVAGVSLHLRQRYLMSSLCHPYRQRRVREKVTGISAARVLNSVR